MSDQKKSRRLRAHGLDETRLYAVIRDRLGYLETGALDPDTLDTLAVMLEADVMDLIGKYVT